MRLQTYIRLITFFYFVGASNVTGKENVFLLKKTSAISEKNEEKSKKEVSFVNFPRNLGFLPSWSRVVPSFHDYLTQLRQDYANLLSEKSSSKTDSPQSKNALTDSSTPKTSQVSNDFSQNTESSSNDSKNSDNTAFFVPSPTKGYIYTGTDDRFNYASVDCAAGIMATNKGARSASAILHKDKDRYLLDTCSSKRFVVIELCQEIEIQTLLISNLEFFSSTFRHFNLYTSSRYPPKEPDGWYLAGTFEALNTRSVQAFDVNLPKIWIKYLKIEFLSHYGDEYYCPVSQIKVFGPTMLVEYLDSQELHTENTLEVDPLSTIPHFSDIYPETTNTRVPSETEESIDFQFPSPLAPLTVKDLPEDPDEFYSITSNIQNLCEPDRNLVLAYPSSSKDWIEPYKSPSVSEILSSLFLPPVCRPTDFHDADYIDSKLNEPLDSQPTDTSSTLKPSSKEFKSMASDDPKNVYVSDEFMPPFTSQTSQTPSPGSSGSENVFRTMARRLNALDSKYTLLENYVNEQSVALNSIFSKLDIHQQQYMQATLKDFSRTTWNQMEAIKRAQEEVWGMLFHKMEVANNKLRSEQSNINHKVNLLAEEVVFGKRLALAQLSVLFIVVVMVILVQLYYSAFNTKIYDSSETPYLSELDSPHPDTGNFFSTSRQHSRRPSLKPRSLGVPISDFSDLNIPPDFTPRGLPAKDNDTIRTSSLQVKHEKINSFNSKPTTACAKSDLELLKQPSMNNTQINKSQENCSFVEQYSTPSPKAFTSTTPSNHFQLNDSSIPEVSPKCLNEAIIVQSNDNDKNHCEFEIDGLSSKSGLERFALSSITPPTPPSSDSITSLSRGIEEDCEHDVKT